MFWTLVSEGENKISIRRYLNGKNIRLPIREYRSLKGNDQELKNLIERLNYPIRTELAKKDIETNRAFYGENHLDEFIAQVRLKQRTNRSGDYQEALLKNYYFTYFPQNNIRTVEEFEDIETRFYLYLFENLFLKYKTIKYIIQTINRYHFFLEKLSKRENRDSYTRYHQFCLKDNFPMVKYNAQNKGYKKKKRIYVSEETFQKLLDIADKRIFSHLNLAYKLGLRRGETYALSEQTVYEDSLEVAEALDSDGIISVPKSSIVREVSYHYITPHEVVELIRNKSSISVDLISKLTKEAVDKMIERKIITHPFDFHSLRGSYCSNFLRDCLKFNKSYEDVRQEMGHEDIRTTMDYAYSTRSKIKTKFNYEN